jgi:hypothetical protein
VVDGRKKSLILDKKIGRFALDKFTQERPEKEIKQWNK